MRVEKQLAAIATRLYSKLSKETDHNPGMIAVGHSEESKPNKKVAPWKSGYDLPKIMKRACYHGLNSSFVRIVLRWNRS